MRIISGTLRGRPIKCLEGADIRPTSDKVRGAIFNMLAHASYARLDFSPALSVVDIFSGTGALGFEALSRGAGHVSFVDVHAHALAMARANAAALKVEDKCAFIQRDAAALPMAAQPYDLLFLDPPYRKNLPLPVLTRLLACGWAHEKSLVVVETAKDEGELKPTGFQLHERRIYGDTAVNFLSPVAPPRA